MPRRPHFSLTTIRSYMIMHRTIRFGAYLALVAVMSLLLIYVPNYYSLQIWTAENVAAILRRVGYDAAVQIQGSDVLVNGFQLTRECTGVQALVPVSIFFALMPRVCKARRVLAVVAALSSLYFANLTRIVLELGLYSHQLLPWTIIHDYFGFGFSALAVIPILFLGSKITNSSGVDVITRSFTF